jgi:hypothetical protein
MPNDVPRHVTPKRERPHADIERLQGEIADLKVERDRWHQAFERESALREEETRQLRQLIQQEQALAFSRFAAIEAATQHDAIGVVDASPAETDTPQDTDMGPRHDDDVVRAPETLIDRLRRLLGR